LHVVGGCLTHGLFSAWESMRREWGIEGNGYVL
jgi:hypothetical protein